MIIDELKKANIEALKAHDNEARASLSVAINRFMQVSIENKANKKETTDADTVRILTKLSKELDEEKQASGLSILKLGYNRVFGYYRFRGRFLLCQNR